jgi:hypothetical protein
VRGAVRSGVTNDPRDAALAKVLRLIEVVIALLASIWALSIVHHELNIRVLDFRFYFVYGQRPGSHEEVP